MKIIFLTLFFVFGASFAEITSRDLRCAVCRAVIKEMVRKIEAVSDKKKVQIGGYKFDQTGKRIEKLVPYARSSMHLSELMDEICEMMTDYVRATDKKTKQLAVLKLISSDGGMNSEISNYDIVQDSDLNQSLTFHCEGIIEEYEGEIVHELQQPTGDSINSICTKLTNLCDSSEKDEL